MSRRKKHGLRLVSCWSAIKNLALEGRQNSFFFNAVPGTSLVLQSHRLSFRAQKLIFTSAATKKQVLRLNLNGQKPVKPLLIHHASFNTVLRSGPVQSTK